MSGASSWRHRDEERPGRGDRVVAAGRDRRDVDRDRRGLGGRAVKVVDLVGEVDDPRGPGDRHVCEAAVLVQRERSGRRPRDELRGEAVAARAGEHAGAGHGERLAGGRPVAVAGRRRHDRRRHGHRREARRERHARAAAAGLGALPDAAQLVLLDLVMVVLDGDRHRLLRVAAAAVRLGVLEDVVRRARGQRERGRRREHGEHRNDGNASTNPAHPETRSSERGHRSEKLDNLAIGAGRLLGLRRHGSDRRRFAPPATQRNAPPTSGAARRRTTAPAPGARRARPQAVAAAPNAREGTSPQSRSSA